MTKALLTAAISLMFCSTAFADDSFRATVLVGQPNHSATVAPALRGHGLEKVLASKGFTGASVDSRKTVTLTQRPQTVFVGSKTVSLTLKRTTPTNAVIDVERRTKKGIRHSEVTVGRDDPTMVFMRGSK